MTVEIVQLDREQATSDASRQAVWHARLADLARARSLALNGRTANRTRPLGSNQALAEPAVATIPLVPRSFAHLPAKRWSWAARRRLAQDHPFGRIARIEANLEQLVDELEAEVDRLVARTGELLGDGPRA
jgi:hypothetical protein